MSRTYIIYCYSCSRRVANNLVTEDECPFCKKREYIGKVWTSEGDDLLTEP